MNKLTTFHTAINTAEIFKFETLIMPPTAIGARILQDKSIDRTTAFKSCFYKKEIARLKRSLNF